MNLNEPRLLDSGVATPGLGGPGPGPGPGHKN